MKNVIIVMDWFDSEEDIKVFLFTHHEVVLKLVNYKEKREYKV